MDKVFIQHRFILESVDTSGNVRYFSDAITLPKSDYELLNQADIQTIKQERLTGWVQKLLNPPPEPSKEDALAAVEKQIVDLLLQKDHLLSEIAKDPKGGTK